MPTSQQFRTYLRLAAIVYLAISLLWYFYGDAIADGYATFTAL